MQRVKRIVLALSQHGTSTAIELSNERNEGDFMYNRGGSVGALIILGAQWLGWLIVPVLIVVFIGVLIHAGLNAK